MLLRDFLKRHNLKLIVRYNTKHAWAGQYTVKLLPSVDIIDGFVRRGVWGHGTTPRLAIEDYIRAIQGCTLEANRVHIEVPEDLALGKSVSCALEWK